MNHSLLRLMPRFLLAVLFACVLAFQPIHAEDDDVDYLELATILAGDGEYERAEVALRSVDTEVEEFDFARYHTLRGMIALNQDRQEDAANAFGEAIDAGQTDPLIHLYRAQAYFGLEKYKEAVAAIEQAGDAVADLSGAWLLRAHANWMIGDRQEAMNNLTEASDRFPGNNQFMRRQVFYLIDAGFYKKAADIGRVYLTRAEAKPEDYAAIGGALRQSGSFDEALKFLETAHMRYPSDLSIGKALAQTYVAKGELLAAAELLSNVAVSEPELYPEAAELFRRRGHTMRALALNAKVRDQEKKLKQRVGILVEMGKFEELIAMEESLYRSGSLKDEDIRYALAYAHFRGGSFEKTEEHLSALTRPELFRKATELRKLMQECGDNRWTCS